MTNPRVIELKGISSDEDFKKAIALDLDVLVAYGNFFEVIITGKVSGFDQKNVLIKGKIFSRQDYIFSIATPK